MSSNHNRLPLKNYYDYIEQDNKPSYKRYNEVRIEIPFRMLIVGGSGSMKTSVFMNLLEKINVWRKIYIITRQTTEPLYELLSKIITNVEKKTKKQILVLSNSIDALPPIDDFSTDCPSLVVFDDMVNGSAKEFQAVAEIYTRGRKVGISSIFISQSFFKVPLIIRQNTNYLILKKISSNKDFLRIIREYSMDITEEQLKQMYNKIIHSNLLNFMLIDLQTNDDKLKFRHNFGC